jgi:hypothetical protein
LAPIPFGNSASTKLGCPVCFTAIVIPPSFALS